MWPLSIVLLLATAAPQLQQGSSTQDGAYAGKLPQIHNVRGHDPARKLSPQQLRDKNTCYAIRSYHFERQDGQAPVLAGMTTCTPSRILEQKRVSPEPGLFVPLGLQSSAQKQPE